MGTHLDWFRHGAALENCCVCSKELHLKIKLGLFLGVGEQASLFQTMVVIPAWVGPETITMFGMAVYLS